MYTHARSKLLLTLSLSLSMLAACEGGGGTSSNFCVHRCTSTADCTIGGADRGLTCQDNVCTSGSTNTCTSNEQCTVELSLWTSACTAGGTECDTAIGEVCIETVVGPRCAFTPSTFPCDTITGFVELARMGVDGSPVTVCGDPRAECDGSGFCFSRCQTDADCSGATPVCNTSTGRCNCGTDAHCAMLELPDLAACVNGFCGCATDQQCIDGNAGDVCLPNGACGCSGDSACAGVQNPFGGGSIVCGQ
jgi:hypothetical protein